MIHDLLAQLDAPSSNVVYVVCGTLFSALSTVIGIMWKFMVKKLNAVERKLTECEDDREKLWETLAFNRIKQLPKDSQ